MKKCGADPKVKKTLVRNVDQKLRPTTRKTVVHDVGSSASDVLVDKSRPSKKENELNQPSLCSSELLANYLSEVKNNLPPPLSSHDLNVAKTELCSKMTKKLNFHFNDRIYKNLVELNTSTDSLQTKKGKRPPNFNSIKRDLEPSIEDFYEEIVENDVAPNIPVMKPKFKAVKRVEHGELHRLVASFENL